MAERTYKWYVESLRDVAYTNAVIARTLAEEVECPNAIKDAVCEDGKKHDLWNCSEKVARNLWNSRSSLHINIKIWRKEGEGEIRSADFLFQRRTKAKLMPASAIKPKATRP